MDFTLSKEHKDIQKAAREFAVGEFARIDLHLGDARFEFICIHRHRVEMCSLDDPLGMDEQRPPRVYKRRDIGHGHIFAVAKAGIEE